MPDIFLSYSREDQAIARHFAEGLKREGFNVWWDQALNAGESFDQVTERRLKEARAVVVLWTRRSVQSRWVRSEATLADRYGTLVPVMLEPCDRPIMFELTHTADLAGWKGDAKDPRWQTFVAGLRRMMSSDVAAIATAIPATPPRAALRLHGKPLRWAVIGAAVLAAAGLGWWLMRDSGGESTAAASTPPRLDIGEVLAAAGGMRRLTDFEGIEEQAAISPDGTLVGFASDRDGPKDIWITRIGTNEFRNLTQGRHLPQYSPETRAVVFSAEGSEIHFTGRPAQGADSDNVWSVPVLGGAVRLSVDDAIELAWSRDGARLAYHTRAAGDPIFIREGAQGADRQLLVSEPGEHNHFLTWSLDGAFLYFLHGADVLHGMAIWRVAAAGGPPEQLTSPPQGMRSLVFLDAQTLAFLAEESEGAGLTIHLLDVETGKLRAVPAGLERFTSLAADRSGRRLIATVSTQRSSLWRVPVDARKVATQAQRIRVSTRGSTSPRRAGNDLLHLSNDDAGSGIWRSEGDSTTEVWNPGRGSVAGRIAVEPGGRRIAFPVRQDGMTRLHVGNTDGTGMRALAPELNVRGSPAWSPDRKWIAIAAETAEGPRLYRIAVEGGEAVQLTQDHALDPTWSPQGGFIVYAAAQVGPNFPLAAVTADGEPHSIPSITLPRGSTRTVFLPGEDAAARLIVMKGDLQQTDFWTVDLASGKERRLTELGIEYQLGDFDLSADGREILFDRVREESDVVLIDLG